MNFHLTKPFWFLLIFEPVLIFIFYYVGLFARWAPLSNFSLVIWQNLLQASLYTATIVIAMIAMGLYSGPCSRTLSVVIGRLIISILLSFLFFSLISYVFPTLALWRSPLAIAIGLTMVGILCIRLVFLRVINQNLLKWRVLVLGTGPKAAHIHDVERDGHAYGFTCVGFLEDPEQPPQVPMPLIIRKDRPLAVLAEGLAVDQIIVAARDTSSPRLRDELIDCKFAGVRIVEFVEFLEKETGQVHLDAVDQSWFIFSGGFTVSTRQMFIKRTFDIIFALVCITCLTPLALITALAIRIEGPGPVLYRQTRVGLQGRNFEMIKFRSMRTDAEKDGSPVWASVNDPRTTAVGAMIRKTRMDEIPQILNVLRGQMSFVGPRPERPSFVELLTREIPYYHERLRVKPGITGWAQLNYIYSASIEGAREKFQFDLYYIKHFGLVLDLFIMLQTVRVLLWPQGVR